MVDLKRLQAIVHSVQQAVRWLKGQAENINGTRGIAITVSALIAAERNPHSHFVQRLASGLIEQQGETGSWNDAARVNDFETGAHGI